MSPTLAAATDLLERSGELADIALLIEGAIAGSGGTALIVGEAGIGKTSLLDAAADLARSYGVRVLRARGSELERPYAFGVAIATLASVVRDRSRTDSTLWAGAAGRARGLFDTTPDDGGGSEPFAVIHGLTWLVTNAADDGALLVVVDEAQWADDASMRWLHRLAQEVPELRVALVLAFRTGEPAREVSAETLATAPGAIELRPAPLSRSAVAQLLASVRDDEVPSTVADAILATTGGNPFFVTELLREPDAWPTPPGQGVEVGTAVPASIGRFAAGRIERLDPVAREVAEAVAILDREATGPRVADLTGHTETVVETAARQLIDAGVLDRTGALRFIHPIVRSSVYDSIPLVSRARFHRVAGLRLHADGVAIGIVGGQLLAAGASGDARVVDLLREAAAETTRRGEPATSARLLRRALEEPPTADLRVPVMLELARAEALATPATAIESYRKLLELVADPLERARLHLDLGHTLHAAADWGAAAEAFEAGLAELDGLGDRHVDPQLRDRLEAGFVSAAWVGIERYAEAEAIVDRILREEQLGSVHRELAVWTAFQRTSVVSTTADEAQDLVVRALADTPADELITIGQLVEVAAGVLASTDALALEDDLLTRSIAAAERAGAIGKVGIYSYCRAWPRLYMGRLGDAISDAQTSLEVGELGAETFMPAARSALALAHLERGEVDAAAAAIEIDDERWGSRIDFALLVPIVRARMALARGQAAEALTQLDRSAAFTKMLGFRVPIPPDWRVWRIVALLHLGRRDEARATAEEALGIAREWGARWPLGVALRGAGLADGGAPGVAMMEEAVAILRDGPAVLELARTEVELGAAMRRLGRTVAARKVLTEAGDRAHRLGATALATRARDELVAAGARPRRVAITGVDALTPAERRVADLAAEGRTNRQIAESLFVTPKAVEFHLANAFPKLGIGSRRELPGALGRAGPA